MDNHTARKIIAQRRAMRKVELLCDQQNLCYPMELIQWLRKVNRGNGSATTGS